MPKLSGWEVLDIFININLKIPVFMVTSSLDNSERIKAVNHPLIKGFYIKPLTINDLQQMVASL
jgi:CheY-like chemotaxis protein